MSQGAERVWTGTNCTTGAQPCCMPGQAGSSSTQLPAGAYAGGCGNGCAGQPTQQPPQHQLQQSQHQQQPDCSAGPEQQASKRQRVCSSMSKVPQVIFASRTHSQLLQVG